MLYQVPSAVANTLGVGDVGQIPRLNICEHAHLAEYSAREGTTPYVNEGRDYVINAED